MKTKNQKHTDILIPQLHVRTNIKSGPDTVAPLIADVSSVRSVSGKAGRPVSGKAGRPVGCKAGKPIG
jgi:hypothetical protein